MYWDVAIFIMASGGPAVAAGGFGAPPSSGANVGKLKGLIDMLDAKSVANNAIRWGGRLAQKMHEHLKEGKFKKGSAEELKEEAKKSAEEMIADAKRDVLDLSDLPDNFDYTYALKIYVWSVILLTSKTLGHRLARAQGPHALLEALLNKIVASLFCYVILPAAALVVPEKLNEDEFPVTIRQIVIVVLSFVFGLLGEHVFIHYIHMSMDVPSYYFPAVIGLTLQFMGPQFSRDRKALLFCCVSSAVVISVSLAYYANLLSVGYVISTTLNAMSSILNLQLMIADMKRNQKITEDSHIVAQHYRIVVINVFTHAILTMLLASYDANRVNASDTAVE